MIRRPPRSTLFPTRRSSDLGSTCAARRAGSQQASSTTTIITLAVAARVMMVLVLLARSEEHTSELQSRLHLVCRLLLVKKKRRYDERIESAVYYTHIERKTF